MDLSLVFLNSVMFLFVKFSSAVQWYCCSRCTLLNFFLLTHSRKCVNLYILNIDTRLTCWDMEILIWCLAASFWNRKLLFSKTMVNKASWMHWITKAETCSRLALWCTLFSLYKMQKMYEVYVHLWVIYLWAVLKVLLNYFHIQPSCRLNHTNYVTYSVWFFISFCRRRSEEYLYGIWVAATSSCSHMVRNIFTWCHIPSIT